MQDADSLTEANKLTSFLNLFRKLSVLLYITDYRIIKISYSEVV